MRCGPFSVRFFFVLTGYFITLSLWKVQDEIRDQDEGVLIHLGRYYLARLLRIGPPFYLSLVVGALFGIEEVRTNFFWLAIFQANNYIAYLGYWPDAISHYWSLAVQEQFYIALAGRRAGAAAAVVHSDHGRRLSSSGWSSASICVVTDASTITRWVTLSAASIPSPWAHWWPS